MGTRSTAVLLSGGVDSAVTMAFLQRAGWNVEAVFIDFGQPPAEHERAASRQVAERLGAPWEALTVGGLDVVPFVAMPGRNDLLIALAAAAKPTSHLAVGVHAGTGYIDCSVPYVGAWRSLYDLEYGGERQFLAPLVEFNKADVLRLAVEFELPLELTWSCEAANGPCGTCPSCRDRSPDGA